MSINRVASKRFFLIVCVSVLFLVISTISLFLSFESANKNGIVELKKQKEKTSIKQLHFSLPMNETEFNKLWVLIGERKDVWYWYKES